MQRIVNFLKNSKGATAIEYALICALIAVALGTTFTAFKGQVNSLFTSVGSDVAGASAAAK